MHPLIVLRIPVEEETVERLITDRLTAIGYAQNHQELNHGMTALWKTIQENHAVATQPHDVMQSEDEEQELAAQRKHHEKLLTSLTGIVVRSMRTLNPQEGDQDPVRSMLCAHSRLPQQIHPHLPLHLECALPSQKVESLVQELQAGPLNKLITTLTESLEQKSDIDFVINDVRSVMPYAVEDISETNVNWDEKIIQLADHLFWFEALFLHDIGHMIISHALYESLPFMSHLQVSVTGLRRLLYYASLTKPELYKRFLQDEIKRRLTLHEEAFAQDSARRRMMLDLPPRLIMPPTNEQEALRGEVIDILLAKRAAQHSDNFPPITHQQNSFGWNLMAEVFWTIHNWGKSDADMRRALEVLEGSAQTTITLIQRSYPRHIPADVQLYYDEGILVRALCRAALEVPRHSISVVIPRIHDELLTYPCTGNIDQCREMIRSSLFGSLTPIPAQLFIIPTILTAIITAHKHKLINNALDILHALKIPLMALLRLCMLEQADNTRTIKRIVALWRLIHMAAEGEKQLGRNALTPEQFPRHIVSGFKARE